MAKPRIIYKLPLQFQQAHKDVLESWDWKQFPKMPLASALPDIPDLADIVLELMPPNGLVRRSAQAEFVVRIGAVGAKHASGAHMVALRKYSEALESGSEGETSGDTP